MVEDIQDPTEITRESYDEVAHKYDEVYGDNLIYQNELDDFLRYINAGSKILDVGCGSGNVVNYLVEKGFDVVGIDISPNMIDIAKRKNTVAKFELMDMRDMTFMNSSFDSIVSIFSLVHLTKQEVPEILKKFNDLLRKDGNLFVGVSEGTGEGFVDEHLELNQRYYYKYFTKDELRELLEKVGFQVLKTTDRFLEEQGSDEFFVIARKS